MADEHSPLDPNALSELELPPPEEVDRVLDLEREDQESLPGLYRLNVIRTPAMRLVGMNLFLALAFLHNLLLRGGIETGPAISIVLAVEGYALGAWLLLWIFFTRLPKVHLGTVFLVTDLLVMDLVLLFTGGTESYLWPVFCVRVADQLFVGRRRALGMLVAGLAAYGLLVGYSAFFLHAEVRLGVELIKFLALAWLGLYLALAATIPWNLQEKAHRARDMILRLEDQTLALNRERRRAEEASKAKSGFLARMSHELRTPLNSVIGFARVLSQSEAFRESPRETEFLDRIRENGVHLLALINDILDISRIEEGALHLEMTDVGLGGLVRSTVAQLEGTRRQVGVDLLLEMPDEKVYVRADEARLRQVLINLVGNALKFTEEGSVRVRVQGRDGTGVPWSLHVEDTGIGIAPDRLDRIFNAFEQVDGTIGRRHPGTGLGLAISLALCRLMGLRLEVSSEEGKGSTFSVLPGREDPSPTGV